MYAIVNVLALVGFLHYLGTNLTIILYLRKGLFFPKISDFLKHVHVGVYIHTHTHACAYIYVKGIQKKKKEKRCEVHKK